MSYEDRNEQPEFGMPTRGQIPTGDDDDDLSGAAEHASRNAGGSGDRDLFSSILGNFVGNKSQLANEDIDEQAAVSHHKKFFGGNSDDDDGEEANSGSMGNAAAMQALKMFTGGSSSSSSSGSSQSEFIGLAMSEASKLFEQQSSQGKVSSGSSKESAVQQAGEMALKMYLKSKGGSGGSGSSGGGGGAGGLLSLASKFM
ncbi:hypothetical protein VMCG_03634 [Cytospora schulzeri]|uniref:DUF7721 domain-containing protein n=1 Tax=Cytospora schulzeri TaxID=448051 RepID=A0A423WW88_9PEZI|nr:hypothetical protein VMCG_03634 [Valsa malicola]